MTSEKKDFKQTHLPHRKLLLRKYHSFFTAVFWKKKSSFQIWAKGFIQQMTRHVSYRVTSCHDLWGHPRTSDPISNPEAWKWPGARTENLGFGGFLEISGGKIVKDQLLTDGMAWKGVYVRGVSWCGLMWVGVFFDVFRQVGGIFSKHLLDWVDDNYQWRPSRRAALLQSMPLGVVKEMLGCYGHVMPQKSQVGKGTKPSLPGSLA